MKTIFSQQEDIHTQTATAIFDVKAKDVTSDMLMATWRNLLLKKHYFTKDDWINEIAADNKQANINKEECFNIRRKLSLKCAEAEVRVMIIWLP